MTIIDISDTIIAKSDQLNSDDLITGPITVKITKVVVHEKTKEQPLDIYYEGDNGKPWRPCKTMRKLLAHHWGKDGSKFVGQSLTLYRESNVRFGGVVVGGIRISHMTGLKSQIEKTAFTATRGRKEEITVRRLDITAPQVQATAPKANAIQMVNTEQAAQIKDILSKLPPQETKAFLDMAKIQCVEELEARRFVKVVQYLDTKLCALEVKEDEALEDDMGDIPAHLLEAPPLEDIQGRAA
jgi:hypothetical protein